MEDILASIRRILSDDEAEAAGSAAAAQHQPAQDDAVPLDPSMIIEEPQRPATPPPAIPPSGLAAPAAPPSVAPPGPAPRTLVAPEAAAAAAASVGTLVRTLISEREQVAVHRGGPSIEDLVREEIRPLLKLWLDTNLPPLVERLVRAEIERVVSRTVS
jgi:cell pole-organizing protein PopZ